MKPFLLPSRIALATVIVLFVTVPARSADSLRVGSYDFDYVMGGDARARPVQVFDDGRSTYFQFRAGDVVPAIFATRAGVPQLVVPTLEGPYVRVPELDGRFVLQVGRAQAHVIHSGRPDAPKVAVVAPSGMTQRFEPAAPVPPGSRLVASLTPVPMTFGDEQALDRNSYATPVKGDRVYWPDRTDTVKNAIGFPRGGYVLSREAQREIVRIAHAASSSTRFTVIGRDDDSYKEGLERARAEAMRDALVKAGIESDRITVRTGVAEGGAKGKLWESTVVTETMPAAPAMRKAPPPPPVAATPAPSVPANPAVFENVEALVRSGVLNRAQAEALLARYRPPADAAGSARPADAVAAPRAFAMRKADESVERMLQRWGKDAGWRVLWQGAPSMPIVGDADVDRPDFLQAADYVITQARAAGYHIKATAYSNKVLQIVGE